LRKLDEGGYDAIVLAAAGLKRLGLGARIREVFEPSVMLPAAGQGALGIEVRTDRQEVIDALATLAHHTSWLAVSAERAVSRAMGGSCSMPLAAYASLNGDTLTLDAAWGDPEGVLALVCVQKSGFVTDLKSAADLGARVAAQLQQNVLAQGGSFAPPSDTPTPR
jgi:hydroxymethylbilane synthase